MPSSPGPNRKFGALVTGELNTTSQGESYYFNDNIHLSTLAATLTKPKDLDQAKRHDQPFNKAI
jgi:hypothetical protein